MPLFSFQKSARQKYADLLISDSGGESNAMEFFVLRQIRLRDLGRQTCQWVGLPCDLGPAGAILPDELDAIHHPNFGPHVRGCYTLS